MGTATVFYLSSDGSLCQVERPGRCGRYWQLYTRRESISRQIADETDAHRKAALADQYRYECLASHNHVEICEECQSWLAAVEESPAFAGMKGVL